MKKMLLLASLTSCLAVSALADNHASPQGNGAFTTLFVAAKDVDKQGGECTIALR